MFADRVLPRSHTSTSCHPLLATISCRADPPLPACAPGPLRQHCRTAAARCMPPISPLHRQSTWPSVARADMPCVPPLRVRSRTWRVAGPGAVHPRRARRVARDYLWDEVVSALSEAEREVLLNLAVLRPPTPPPCSHSPACPSTWTCSPSGAVCPGSATTRCAPIRCGPMRWSGSCRPTGSPPCVRKSGRVAARAGRRAAGRHGRAGRRRPVPAGPGGDLARGVDVGDLSARHRHALAGRRTGGCPSDARAVAAVRCDPVRIPCRRPRARQRPGPRDGGRSPRRRRRDRGRRAEPVDHCRPRAR